MGNPLARQPKGTHGGAQDSSMSSLQSSRKPDTQPVPCSSTQPAALSPSMMCQAWAWAHRCCRQGNKQGFFHTRHPYGSYSHTVTDVLGGSTKSISGQRSGLHQGTPTEGTVACASSDGWGETKHLLYRLQCAAPSPSPFSSLPLIGNQEGLCLKANSAPKDQTWNLESHMNIFPFPISFLLTLLQPSLLPFAIRVSLYRSQKGLSEERLGCFLALCLK